MSLASSATKTMTGEEILALPEDGIHRELIRGELRERPVTYRNRTHSGTEATIAMLLGNWLGGRPTPKGRFHSGEAGFRLHRDPETVVGVDIAYVSAEMVAATAPKAALYDGGPILAVEILSPSDRQGEVAEKVELYLEVGTVVWLVDTHFRKISVHRPGRAVETFNETQEIAGEPELPGLRLKVADAFA